MLALTLLSNNSHMTTKEFDHIWAVDQARQDARSDRFDPQLGLGCGDQLLRKEVMSPDGHRVMVPVSMLADPQFSHALSLNDFEMLRCRHDFYFWAWRCVTIKDKISGEDRPFRLNAPQRRVVALLEDDRLSGRPMRLIMLKARQWGGSTLVQIYMAWIQSCHRRNWHSLICAHVKDTAATIRGMYSKLLERYPPELWDSDEKPKFVPYERSTNVREIVGRGCRVTLGSAENQEGVRGSDFAMAHLSEVAFWTATTLKDPTKFIRAICGSIARAPHTLIVMESTANGVGNYFHREWLRSERGESDKRAVFVPWYEIEIYSEPVTHEELPALWQSLDTYELNLWHTIPGMTLDRIKWYHNKRREYLAHSMMQAEYPTTPTEAFVNTGHNVFANNLVDEMRKDAVKPLHIGELIGDHIVDDPTGALSVWQHPQPGHSYVATVDIGGRSASSDWSVIAVIDSTATPEVVAQWRGHIDHDLLTRRAADIGRWYNEALLVVESNTLETEADDSLYLLSRLRDDYPNLYLRHNYDTVTGEVTSRVGFHTNRATKAMAINTLIALVREHGYIERDTITLDELSTYELLPNGSMAARSGCHDDCLMTRAIGLHVALTDLHDPLPAGPLNTLYARPRF